jgi:hypothetical protein
MFAAVGWAAVLVLAPVAAPNIQIDPSIPLQGTPFQAPDFLGAMRQGQQYRQNEADMEATRTESDFCARGDWWGWGCSRSQHEEALQRRESRAAAASLREQVARLLANDDCPGAVRAALSGGDFSLAREAREFCGSAPVVSK